MGVEKHLLVGMLPAAPAGPAGFCGVGSGWHLSPLGKCRDKPGPCFAGRVASWLVPTELLSGCFKARGAEPGEELLWGRVSWVGK